jgi:hypothetical protein
MLDALAGVEGLTYVHDVLRQAKVESHDFFPLLEAASRQLHLLKPLTPDTLGEYLDLVLGALQNSLYADYQGTEGLEELIHVRDMPQNAPMDRQIPHQYGSYLSAYLMHGIIQPDH